MQRSLRNQLLSLPKGNKVAAVAQAIASSNDDEDIVIKLFLLRRLRLTKLHL